MEENNVNNQEQELDLNQLMKVRREKLEELQKSGKNPFEVTKYDRTEVCLLYTSDAADEL